jgi:NAD(P)-dependent dehydrogenase (short-subunit alcohol dehydrogenase family)
LTIVGGESVLITGGSSGIGLAAAEFLAARGYRVFATTRSLAARRELIAEAAKKHGESLCFLEMDTTSDASVERGVSDVIQKCGRIDHLVCNAGIVIIGSVEETPISLVQTQLDVNLLGYIRTLRAVVPHMRRQGRGRIVLVSSIAGILAIPYQAHYSMSKYAVEALAEGLRQEVRGFGITVTAVKPGDIRTRIHEDSLRHLPADSPYARWSTRWLAGVDRSMAKAPSPVLVARKIHRILSVPRPRRSYTVSDFLTRMAPAVLPWLPRGLKEKIVRIFYDVDFS